MESKRGRPVGSRVRQNIAEILFFRKKSYGYDLYKDYCEIFPKATMRVIYYNLNKGVSLGEFEVESIRSENGSYSWGSSSERKYYSLSPRAVVKMDGRVKEYFSKKKRR